MYSRRHYLVVDLLIRSTVFVFACKLTFLPQAQAQPLDPFSLTVTTNTPSNCSTGLTYPGVLLLIEYRLVRTLPFAAMTQQQSNCVNETEWQFLQRVILEPAGSDSDECNETTVQISTSNFRPSDNVQLRIVQPEHGGGTCNCWGVRELLINTKGQSEPIDQPECGSQLFTTSTGSCAIQFCGGSASVPRGVVYPPVSLNGNQSVLDCPSDRMNNVTDIKGPPPTDCSSSEPRIELVFLVNMNSKDFSNNPNGFDEGVEVSVGNWDSNGRWIPLRLYSLGDDRQEAIEIGQITGNNVTIRGYTIPYHIQSASDTEARNVSLSVCGDDILRDGIQIRWLQTTRLRRKNTETDYKQYPRDVAALSNVSVLLHSRNASQTLTPSFDIIGLRNSHLFSNAQMILGQNCTTLGCEIIGRTITVSRLAVTAHLNISTFLNKTVIAPTSVCSIDITSIVDSTSVSHSTLIKTTAMTSVQLEPTPVYATIVQQYEALERQDLARAAARIQTIILNNSELQSIQALISQSPERAAMSLRALVTGVQQIDDTAAIYLLSKILSQSVNITNIKEFSQDVLEASESLLSQAINNNQSNTIVGSTLLATVEQLALNVLTPGIEGPRTSNIEVEVFSTNINSTEEFFSGIDVSGNSIQVPTELLRIVGNGTIPVTVASVYYRNMSGLLPGTLPGDQDSILASPVISTSLQCGDRLCNTSNFGLSRHIVITLPHSNHVQALIEHNSTKVQCVFWKFIPSDSPLVSGRWDTDGCERNDLLSDSTQTVCQCTHLTNFAILLSAQPLSLPGGVALSLSITGYIGVSLSVIAMLATIAALAFLKSLWSMRNFIHINVCVSLILSQLTFVIGVTPYGGEGVVGPGCRTAAVLMHYLFLVSFMWMLMEGVVLYVALVRVFVKFPRRYMIGFFVFSYGAPLLYMVLCVPLGFALHPEQSDYGYGYIQAANETTDIPSIVCWLNPYTNFVWTFIAPVLVTILANIGFFIMAFVIMAKHARRQSDQSKEKKAKYWLKSSVSLVTIMGITWIIGVLVFEVPALLPLAYIFTIFVVFQGVAIFIIFVPLSKQVREAYSKWWKVKVAESNVLSRHFGDWSLQFSQGKHSTVGRSRSTGTTSPAAVLDAQSSSPSNLESSLPKPELEYSYSKKSLDMSQEQTKTDEPWQDFGTHFSITFVQSNVCEKEDLGVYKNGFELDCSVANGNTVHSIQ